MMLFDIKPEQIVLTYENGSFSTTNLKMTNRSQSKIAFKIKSTDPIIFTVKPSRGLIEPSSSISIEVQPQKQKVDLSAYAGQKLLVVAQRAGQEKTMAEIDELWRNTDMKSESIQLKKIQTVVTKIEGDQRQQIINPNLVASVYTPMSESKSKSMDREQKKVAFQDNSSLEELIIKEHNLDEQIMKARLKREELYNKVVEQKYKPKQMQLVVPLILGVVVAFLYKNSDWILNYF